MHKTALYIVDSEDRVLVVRYFPAMDSNASRVALPSLAFEVAPVPDRLKRLPQFLSDELHNMHLLNLHALGEDASIFYCTLPVKISDRQCASIGVHRIISNHKWCDVPDNYIRFEMMPQQEFLKRAESDVIRGLMTEQRWLSMELDRGTGITYVKSTPADPLSAQGTTRYHLFIRDRSDRYLAMFYRPDGEPERVIAPFITHPRDRPFFSTHRAFVEALGDGFFHQLKVLDYKTTDQIPHTDHYQHALLNATVEVNPKSRFLYIPMARQLAEICGLPHDTRFIMVAEEYLDDLSRFAPTSITLDEDENYGESQKDNGATQLHAGI